MPLTLHCYNSVCALVLGAERKDSFAAELKALRERCALAVHPAFGSHPNFDSAKHLCAQFAHGLMQMLSERKITGTEGGRFRTIANLLYEAFSGLPDADLERACDFMIHETRGPQTRYRRIPLIAAGPYSTAP
jgi:hypothetical protein